MEQQRRNQTDRKRRLTKSFDSMHARAPARVEEHDDGEKIDASAALKQEQKACEDETRAAEKAKADAKLHNASDFYELLGVKRDATRAQIKKANMKLMKK